MKRRSAWCLAAGLWLLPAAARAADPLWWVFLNKGPHRDQKPGPELQEMQKGHIRNLERLWNEGRSPLAGPLGDDGFTRGIVIVRATSKEDLLAQFEADPHVRAGRLAVEAYPWSGRVDTLRAPSEPPKLVKATLAILNKGPKWTSEAAAASAEAHAKHLASLEKEGELVLSGALEGAGDKLEILLFRTEDADRARSLLAEDPAVKNGEIAVETHPQYLGDGILPPPPQPATVAPTSTTRN